MSCYQLGCVCVFQARRRRSARSPVGDAVRRSARPAGGRSAVRYESCRCEAGYMQQQVGGPEGQQLVRCSGGAATAAVPGSVARNAADDGWRGHVVSARVGGLDAASWPVGEKDGISIGGNCVTSFVVQ